MPTSRPWVLINMAMSADGKVATADRGIETFGSEADHRHLLELRSTVDAVMCGARTAGGAGITMGVGGAVHRRARRRLGLADFPMRVVISGRGGLSPKADLFSAEGGPVVVAVSGLASIRRRRALSLAAETVKEFGSRTVDLGELLRWLKAERGVGRLVCEGGPALNDAMIRADLVDELHLTLCPVIVGGRTALTISEGRGFGRLADASRWVLERTRRVGNELFLVYRRRRG